MRRLEDWYISNCDGDWEHQNGVNIETLDNPGWAIEIDLAGTALERTGFNPVERHNDDQNDWILCRRNGMNFEGFGGPQNLDELLTVFFDWVDANRS